MGKTELLAPGGRVGRYHLVHRLACGGMAELHVACAGGVGGFEKIVALKRVLPHLAVDPRFTAMFLNEARLAGNLDHPNIVQVMDIGEVAGDFYYVMEYVHGRDGRALLREAAQHGGLPLECAVGIVLDAAAGLHHAHERVDVRGNPLGIVHRDVSPSNLLLSYDGVVKVADFGIAKASARDEETVGSAMKGKIGYMSPEQCSGQPVDRRSDVFGLGILLYEFTVNQRLFYGSSDFEVLNRIVRGDYEPPSARVEGYPRELERIVERALQIDPADRYATAKELHHELELFAHETRMRRGQSVLGDYMAMLFGSPPYPRVEVRSPVPHERVQMPTLVLVTETEEQGKPLPTPGARRRPWAVTAAIGAAVVLGWYAGSAASTDSESDPSAGGPPVVVDPAAGELATGVAPLPAQVDPRPPRSPPTAAAPARSEAPRPSPASASPASDSPPAREHKKKRSKRKRPRTSDKRTNMDALYPK